MTDNVSESQSPSVGPKDDPELDDACFHMLEIAEATRIPGDQIVVGHEGGAWLQ